MPTQLESQPEYGGGSGSGGYGDDEPRDDEDEGKDGEDEDDKAKKGKDVLVDEDDDALFEEELIASMQANKGIKIREGEKELNIKDKGDKSSTRLNLKELSREDKESLDMDEMTESDHHTDDNSEEEDDDSIYRLVHRTGPSSSKQVRDVVVDLPLTPNTSIIVALPYVSARCVEENLKLYDSLNKIVHLEATFRSNVLRKRPHDDPKDDNHEWEKAKKLKTIGKISSAQTQTEPSTFTEQQDRDNVGESVWVSHEEEWVFYGPHTNLNLDMAEYKNFNLAYLNRGDPSLVPSIFKLLPATLEEVFLEESEFTKRNDYKFRLRRPFPIKDVYSHYRVMNILNVDSEKNWGHTYVFQMGDNGMTKALKIFMKAKALIMRVEDFQLGVQIY
ncbi:hypothetical protein Tco_0734701 [Tanacetum coccineum]